MTAAISPPALVVPPARTDDLRTQAGRALCAKLLGELSYEQMLVPEPGERPGTYRLRLPDATYAFAARRGAFGAWHVDAGSITRADSSEAGAGGPADDPLRLLLDLRSTLGLPGDTAAEAVGELLATWEADVRLLAGRPSAAALADLDVVALEGHQTGHPCIVLNKGRLGFTGPDAARYTPEARQPLRLRWVAAAPELAAARGPAQAELLADELDPAVRASFRLRLEDALVPDPDSYVWFPVHPWQYEHVVTTLFAAELADRRLVLLGEGPDRYLPMQSIRTLANLDVPQRAAVKLPLMIRNTLVWRGLSTDDADAAPVVSAWLESLRSRDAFLRDECRVILLAEVAGVAVRHPELAEIPDAPYRYAELLSMLWREPVQNHLDRGERARTLASLLLVDRDGRSLLAELVDRSTLSGRAWLEKLFAAMLPPLLHYLCRYGVAFTPHGENVLFVVDAEGVPTRIAVKDFGADLELLPDAVEAGELPEDVRGLLRRWPAGELAHAILSAVCAGHLRFLAPLAEQQLGVREAELWAMVRAELERYRDRHPELRDRFDALGLFAPEVERICLNREQLTGGAFHERSERDADFDLREGFAPNPLAASS